MRITPGFSTRLAVAIAQSGKKKGLVAKAVGLTPLTLSRYLKGDRTPHTTVLVALANELGTSVDFLLGNSQKSGILADSPVCAEPANPYPPDAVSLVGLDVDERRTMVRMLEALRSGDAEIRRHLIGQLKIIEFALQSRRQQPRAEQKDGA